MSVRALLLDLDNTLIDRDAALRGWLESLTGRVPSLDWPRLAALDRGGYGDKQTWFSHLGHSLGLSAARTRALHDAELPRFVALRPDAARLLDRFGGPKVIVTNGASAVQRAKMHAASLESRVDAMVVSDEFGAKKPLASIFRRALSLAGVEPSEAMMIGDHPVTDVLGAQRLGIDARMVRTSWFDVPAGVVAVDSLDEVVW